MKCLNNRPTHFLIHGFLRKDRRRCKWFCAGNKRPTPRSDFTYECMCQWEGLHCACVQLCVVAVRHYIYDHVAYNCQSCTCVCVSVCLCSSLCDFTKKSKTSERKLKSSQEGQGYSDTKGEGGGDLNGAPRSDFLCELMRTPDRKYTKLQTEKPAMSLREPAPLPLPRTA